MNTTLETLLFAVAGIILFGLIFWVAKTESRLKKLFRGSKAKDLEEIVLRMEEDIKKLKKEKEEIEKGIILMDSKLKKSVRGLETIRYNPFPDQGGNQSFALSMLNEEGDGVILSSLYSRDRVSVFAKPVKSGKSDYELTEEESQVLNKARVSARGGSA